MKSIKVIDMKAKEVGTLDLNEKLFGVKPKKHLIKDMVVCQLASRRSGNSSTKGRSEVRGGGAKPFKQKGTGNARQGTSRSPINEGGGVVFGPKKRDYSYKLPKKIRKAALRTALILKNDEKRVFVIDELKFEKAKTKEAANFFSMLKINNALVVDGANKNLELSIRNLKGFKFIKPEGLNVYDVMKHDGLVFSKASMKKVEEALTK